MSNENIVSFNTEAEALAGSKQAWIDTVKKAVSDGHMVINGGIPHSELTGLTDDDIADLKICGTKSGSVEMKEGRTLTFAVVIKAYNIDKWYFPKPNDQFLTNISGYTIQLLPESWLPPSLI